MDAIHRSHQIDARRRELCLPYSARQVLSKSLASLSAATGERAYPLTPTTVADETAFYASEQKTRRAGGPKPRLLPDVTDAGAERLALHLTSAFEFLEKSRSASPFVSPVLLYYAAAQATSALSRAFFDWSNDSRHHGLEVSHRDPIETTTLTIKPRGHFRRLATAAYLLNGGPSIFDHLITFAGTPQLFTGPGEDLEHFNQTIMGTFPTKISLHDLLGLNLGQRLEELRVRMGFRQWHRLPETLFLYDFLLLFLASSMARYDVVGWRTVLEGKTSSYRNGFDAAFSRFDQFGFYHVVSTLSTPTPFRAPRPTAGGPYADWQVAQHTLV